MLSTSCAALSQPSAASVPPPPVDDRINTEASFPNDGLVRLIVTPIAETTTTSTPADSSVEDSTTTTDGPVPTTGAAPVPTDPSSLVLTPRMVAAMPPDAVLEERDGEVGYVDVDGTFVAFDLAALQPAPAAEAEPEAEAEPAVEIEPLYGNPYIDELATDPAVENIIVIGNGTYGVETSDPSVIDPAIFDTVEDVPFGIAQDQYEQYQWHLENDGSSLRRVSGETQIEDADLDIEPTVGRADGKGIVVAVIDSGVDFSHVDLENSAWSNLGEVCGNGIDDEGNGFIDDCHGWDFAFNDSQPFNRGADDHGTHVAGIITGNRNGIGVAGVAPDARIMDLNVAHSGKSMSGAAITAAVYYAVDNGADIINMSLGTNPGASARGVDGMRAAIEYAGSKGVIVVVAAGNNGIDLGSLAVYPASFSLPNMIVVGASTANDERASFSNFNASIVDVYAPGQTILSTTPGNDYRFYSGTSQAAPNAAGVAALVMHSTPDADMATVINQVISTVDPIDALSTSAARGRTNAASALGVGDAPPIPTEFDVSVSGVLGTSNDVNAEIAIVTPIETFSEDYRWELSLITSTDTGAYAVVEHAFTIDGAQTATGLTGAVLLGSSAIQNVAVSTQLPDGHYSFVIEAVPTADGSSRLGDVFVTTFRVGEDLVDADSSSTTVPGDSPAPESNATSTTVQGDSTGNSPVGGGDTSAPDAGNGGTTATTSPVAGGGSTTTQLADGGATSPTTDGAAVEPGTPVTTAPITTAPIGTAPITTAPVDSVPNETAPGDTAPTNTVPAPNAPDSGGGATPVATTPPSTMPTEPAPIPSGLGQDSAANGEWEITSISPRAGYVDNANSVTIRGSFPASAYVWFGDQPGQVVHQTDTAITARTPLRSTDGVVDVSLRVSGVGTALTVPDAFAFVAWGSDVPTGDTGTGSQNGSDQTGDDGQQSGGDGPQSGDGGDQGNGADPDRGGSNSGDASQDSTSSDDSAGDRRSRMTVGSAVELANGLRGSAISPNPAANTPLCSTEPCSGTRRS